MTDFKGGGMTILSRSHLTIFNRWDHPFAFRAFPAGRIENRRGANRHTRPLWAELLFLPSIVGCEGGRACSSTAASRIAFFGPNSADCPVTCCFPTERSVAPVTE